jgi:hypothetical protein
MYKASGPSDPCARLRIQAGAGPSFPRERTLTVANRLGEKTLGKPLKQLQTLTFTRTAKEPLT